MRIELLIPEGDEHEPFVRRGEAYLVVKEPGPHGKVVTSRHTDATPEGIASLLDFAERVISQRGRAEAELDFEEDERHG